MMNSAQTTRADKTTTGQAVFRDVGEIRCDECRRGRATTVQRQRPKRAGYGLPCASCRAYYPADLRECPVCKATVRVSPIATAW